MSFTISTSERKEEEAEEEEDFGEFFSASPIADDQNVLNRIHLVESDDASASLQKRILSTDSHPSDNVAFQCDSSGLDGGMKSDHRISQTSDTYADKSMREFRNQREIDRNLGGSFSRAPDDSGSSSDEFYDCKQSQTVVYTCNKLQTLTCSDKMFPEIKNPSKLANGIIVSPKTFDLADSNVDRIAVDRQGPNSFSHTDCNLSSAKSSYDNSCDSQEPSCLNDFKLASTGSVDQSQSTLNQDHNWASFGGDDDHASMDDSWLAFQDCDVNRGDRNSAVSETMDSKTVNRPGNISDDAEESCFSSEGKVGKYLKSAFPSHNFNLSDANKDSVPARGSYNVPSCISNLCNLIGERSARVATSDDADHSSVHGTVCRSPATVWNSLKVMENTAALKFQWNGSHSNKLLLKSVAMESPTRLSGRRVQKPSVVRSSQEVSDPRSAVKTSCRRPCDPSFSQQTVLSASHLRM